VVGFHYMVPIVDGDNRVRVVRAMGVDSIVALGTAQGLGEQAGEASKGRGADDWHGQSGLDASAHREQPG
jgi:hypothetical protein